MSDADIRISGDVSEASPSRSANVAEVSWGAERRGVARLFLDYYGLSEQPFGVTPDLRFLYLGPKHRQALDVLNYGTELNRGFLTLIAEPGMGKTSLLFQYLEGLREKARTVFLFQTDCDSADLMRYLLADLGLDGTGMGLPAMRAMLSQVLLHEMNNGKPFVLVIDEAQNLDDKVLESVRLLSNFETPWTKLVQIVLAGQPQLAEKLNQPNLAQLRQRISFSVRIDPLTPDEVDLYLDHRLWVAGYKGSSLFTPAARALLAERSKGIPRNINNMCFCAMSFAWAMKQKTIGREMMQEVLADLDRGYRNDAEISSRDSAEAVPELHSTGASYVAPHVEEVAISGPSGEPAAEPTPGFELEPGPAQAFEPGAYQATAEPAPKLDPASTLTAAEAASPSDGPDLKSTQGQETEILRAVPVNRVAFTSFDLEHDFDPATFRLPGEIESAPSPMFYPVGFANEPEPPRGPLSKIVVAGVLLILLGWAGVQFDTGKWIEHPLHSLSDTVKSIFVPARPVGGASPVSSSTTPNSGGLSADQNSAAPQATDAPLGSSTQGHN